MPLNIPTVRQNTNNRMAANRAAMPAGAQVVGPQGQYQVPAQEQARTPISPVTSTPAPAAAAPTAASQASIYDMLIAAGVDPKVAEQMTNLQSGSAQTGGATPTDTAPQQQGGPDVKGEGDVKSPGDITEASSLGDLMNTIGALDALANPGIKDLTETETMEGALPGIAKTVAGPFSGPMSLAAKAMSAFGGTQIAGKVEKEFADLTPRGVLDKMESELDSPLSEENEAKVRTELDKIGLEALEKDLNAEFAEHGSPEDVDATRAAIDRAGLGKPEDLDDALNRDFGGGDSSGGGTGESRGDTGTDSEGKDRDRGPQ